jgi:hypothetical protein
MFPAIARSLPAPGREVDPSFERPRLGARRCGTKALVEREAREMPMNPKVDAFLERQDKWRPEFEELRKILLGSGLTEELKWGQPC